MMEDQNSQEMQAQTTTGGKPISFIRKGHTNVTGKDEIVEGLRVYYLEQRKAGRTDVMQIFREYRKDLELAGKEWFNPYPNVIKNWFKKWEMSLPFTARKVAVVSNKETRNKKETALAERKIEYEELESGAKTLQALLIEDANKTLEESNTPYEMFGDDGFMDKEAHEKLRIKKKEFALGVAKEILGGVHKHQLVAIKKNKEGRETAGFLMDLMRQAASGELSDASVQLLDDAIPNV